MSEPFVLHCGNSLDILKNYPDNHFDSIVTDPPYGISFMGRKWDYDVPSQEIWAECLRVLKPGGHLLAFAGTRTQHRMAVRIEDAGFEIRDMIAWVYGSGMPKSLDVSKAIDKAAGAEREILSERANRSSFDPDAEGGGGFQRGTIQITVPATDAAKKWDGWGTSLKPALEPITVARKPLIGTVAENVLAHGTGAINIDSCRIPTSDKLGGGGEKAETSAKFTNDGWKRPWMDDPEQLEAQAAKVRANVEKAESLGRFPANLIHDGSDEVVSLFPNSKSCSSPSKATPSGKIFGGSRSQGAIYPGEDGSAARFFYCAKTSRQDRNEGLYSNTTPMVASGATMRECEDADWKSRNGNYHPTVKPTDLMAYLCRLVTSPNGIILDPFMGSGSTGKAAIREGFKFVGIDMQQEYVDISNTRISHELKESSKLKSTSEQLDI